MQKILKILMQQNAALSPHKQKWCPALVPDTILNAFLSIALARTMLYLIGMSHFANRHYLLPTNCNSRSFFPAPWGQTRQTPKILL